MAVIRYGADRSAPAAGVDHIPGIAVDHQLVALLGIDTVRAAGGQVISTVGPVIGIVEVVEAGHIQHVFHAQRQGVVAAADQVDALNRFDARGAARAAAALIRDSAKIEGDAGPVQAQRIQPAAAIHPGQLAGVAACTAVSAQRGNVVGVEDDEVVPGAAVQDIGATAADQGVVASIPDQGFGDSSTGQGIIAGGAELVYGRLTKRTADRAENHIAAPGINAGGRIAEHRPDDQVGQAVAVDIPGTGYTHTAIVTRALAVDDKAAAAGRYRG